MNMFVSIVKLYSEVGSRDHLVASDERVHNLVGSWFRNSSKRTETMGKILLKKTSFQVRAGPACKRDRNKAEIRKLKNTTLRNDRALLSGLQCNAFASLVQFEYNKVNSGCKCIALENIEEGAIIP